MAGRKRPNPHNIAAWLAGLGFAVIAACGVARAAGDDRASDRRDMLTIIQAHARYAPEALGRDYVDASVIDAMARIPRHQFVPSPQRNRAYADRPLPIGFGQTISQPFIVALMTDLLRVEKDDVVLEIGTGSGYQAAVLTPLAQRVYSIEIVPALADRAKATLQRLGYANATTRAGDGYFGWAEAAPFDAIVVTAAASHIPPPLVEQLKRGGRMVIPVGNPFAVQQLVLVEKGQDGRVRTRQLLPVRFVPLTRKRDE